MNDWPKSPPLFVIAYIVAIACIVIGALMLFTGTEGATEVLLAAMFTQSMLFLIDRNKD